MPDEKTKSALQTLREDLIKLRGQFKMALPAHIPVEKFERTVITAVQNNPKLAQCDRGSFWAACMKAASDGLLPDGRESAIVPFKDKQSGVMMAQYLQMIGGILKKIRNSGELASLSPHVVYEKDTFTHWVDEQGEHFKHEPCLDDAGAPRFVYCLARLKDGSIYFELMTKKQIETVKSCSRAQGSLKWNKFWEEGAKVAVVKRLAKRLPSSTDIDPSLYTTDKDEYDFDETTGEVEEPKKIPPAPATQSKRLKAAVADTNEKPAQPEKFESHKPKPSPEKTETEKQAEKQPGKPETGPEPDTKTEPAPRQREPGDDDESVEEEMPL